MVRIRTPMAGKGPTLPLRLVLRALQPQVLTRWDVRVVGGGVLQTSSFQRGLAIRRGEAELPKAGAMRGACPSLKTALESR